MIKVAVISDLHGNMEAISSVFKKIDNLEIKNILILGDIALMGPELNEAITFVKNLSEKYNTEIIQGNTDLFILQEELPNVPDFAKNSILYAQKVITTENKEFLKNLPSTKSIKIGGTSILMVHGSPRKNDENIMPGGSIEEIKPMLEDVNEALILCGHTHLPAGYQIEKQTVVNVGSVGRPFTENQKACFVILEIDEEKENVFSVEHCFVDYDVNLAAQKLAKLDFEGAKYLSELLLKSSVK